MVKILVRSTFQQSVSFQRLEGSFEITDSESGVQLRVFRNRFAIMLVDKLSSRGTNSELPANII